MMPGAYEPLFRFPRMNAGASTKESEVRMATTTVSQTLNRGGAFLVASTAPEDVFTPADLNDDQRLLGRTIEEFMAKEVAPHIPELEKHKEGLMAQLVRKAGEIGLLGAGIPEEYGGAALDKVSSVIVSEKLGVYASFTVAFGAHTGIGTIPLVYFGTDAQKKKYLPKIASGELLACYALSEPQAGSDALAARARAVLSPDGKNWLLSGQKMWITSGGFSDLYTVFAKVDGEKFSAFLVERGTPGFSTGAEENKMGIRGSSTVPLFFENAAVPKENLLYEIGRGHIVAFNTLNAGRFSLGASCTGGAKQVLALSAKYSKERTAFGKSICEFGLVETKLGEMAVRIYAVESMIYRTAGNDRRRRIRGGNREGETRDGGARGIRDREFDYQGGGERDSSTIAPTKACRFSEATAFTKIIPWRESIATAGSIAFSKGPTKLTAW